MNWTLITQQLPPDGEVVEAKFEELAAIHDVIYTGNRWQYAGYANYCRYTPTHWRKKEKK